MSPVSVLWMGLSKSTLLNLEVKNISAATYTAPLEMLEAEKSIWIKNLIVWKNSLQFCPFFEFPVIFCQAMGESGWTIARKLITRNERTSLKGTLKSNGGKKHTLRERSKNHLLFSRPDTHLIRLLADGELGNKETSLRERFGNLKITDLKGTTDTVRTLCECLPRRHCCCCCCSCRGASCLWRWQKRSLRSNTSAEERESQTILTWRCR